MKSRVLFVFLLMVVLLVLITQKNRGLQNSFLDIVNPIKQQYKRMTRMIENRGDTYIFQQESIQKLTKENRLLKKYLLDQANYLRQTSTLFEKLPSLEKLPYRSIALIDTISYVRLNTLDEVLLTKPEKNPLENDKVYGLIQNTVVAGTATVRNGYLHGYLYSNNRCKFGVFIGAEKAPGIAGGLDRKRVAVKYIPKWSKIAVGDKVETSGLDQIFFANVPVGIVESIEIEDSYKTAYVKMHADIHHPDLFFLVIDPAPYLTKYYNQDSSFPKRDYSFSSDDAVAVEEKNITSLPETHQTKDDEVNLDAFETRKEKSDTPEESEQSSTPRGKPKKKPVTKKPTRKTEKRRRNTNKPSMIVDPKDWGTRQGGIVAPVIIQNSNGWAPVKRKKKKRKNPLNIFEQ